jgi:hypothetical protein
VEKNQYELCVEVLRRLDSAGILKKVILIGSWCIPFYKGYFTNVKYLPSIKTRDVDFLVPTPLRTKTKVDVPGLLKDMGFIVGFKGSQGYIKLEHPELVIEFLVPEKGRGIDKPYPLPQLGLNAQALRFLNFLIDDTVHIKVEDILVTLPHPANFALHKLIIFQRRRNLEKITKDRNAAIKILKALINKGETKVIKAVFNSIPQKWQKKILKGLEKAEAVEILSILQ